MDMLKVCINRPTGGKRHGGHFTHFSFTGLPGVEIAALADTNAAAKENFHLTGAKKLYTSYEEMVQCEKPDIVDLCSRLPEEHYTEIKYALEHKCHVLCEKPLADDLFHAYELAELAKKNNCRVQLAHLARFAPTFAKMKEMISSGAIGRVLTCYMRGKEDTRGGGEDMIVLGTHIFDAACMIFGLPEMVYSDIRHQDKQITANDIIETTEPLGPCGGDEIFAHFRFKGGVNGIFESRRGLVSGFASSRLGITVCGTEGTLTIRYTGNRSLRLCRNHPVPVEDNNLYEEVILPDQDEIPGSTPIDPDRWGLAPGDSAHIYYANNNRRAAWDLLNAIRENREPAAGIDSAIHSLEMIVGVYQSAINHAQVSLPLENRRHPLSEKN